ncbi:MAG: 2-oxoglutarate dehydrogenase complex dihydrolipoyllysine-residue succinyltransferase [Rhizobiales bacterium]|nr:2-oxoglutarate dehydrogenase complex dihydrolipoyllysine-residue succinyltransferase [Hyphomicrobiales bacterium]NRB14609.1 2-oxoglutarate dehydrogenase complex dihydrolipoyllysine-residue succinyltransferase [Hyphomicrobiales bacterium]
MTIEIRVPTMGESVSEAEVATWNKQPGDAVSAEEVLVELETDKVTLEVLAPVSGVLKEIVAADGDVVGPDAILAIMEEGEIAAPKPVAPKAAAEPAPAPSAPASVVPTPAAPLAASPAASTASLSAPNASPAVAKIAAESGVDVASVAPTGPKGNVTKADMQNAVANPAPVIAPVAAPEAKNNESREERVKMSRLRKTIAKRLKDVQNTAAMLTTFNEVDMTAVMDMRTQYKELFLKKHGTKLGFMSFFVKACVAALKDIPTVNAEIDGGDIIYKNYYNVAVAIGTDKGLFVPVLHDADDMSFAGVEGAIVDYAVKARSGKLGMDDMQGGTFTITNGGVYGSLMSTPILNAPQSGILGMHKIQPRPMAIDGKIEIRPMMYLALSYDHRIVDGKEAVTFLVRVKEALEDPQRLVLDL